VARLLSPWLIPFFALIAAVLVQKPVVLPADTYEYLAHDPTRPPLYPLFLDLTRLIFRSHWARPTVLLQTAFAGVAAWYLARALEKRLGLGRWALLPYIVLLIPILELGVYLGSDAIAYGLLLLCVGTIVDLIYEPRTAPLLRPFWLATVAVLTRNQYLFVVPVLLLGLICILFVARAGSRLRAVASVAAILLLPSLIGRTYNLAVNHRFTTISNLGIQLLTMTSYVMSREDLASLDQESERRFMTTIFERAQERHLLLSSKEQGTPTSLHLYSKYIGIEYGGIASTFAEQFTPHVFSPTQGMQSLSIDELKQMDRFTTSIAIHSLKPVWKRYLMLVAKNFYQHWNLFGLFCFTVLGLTAITAFFRRDQMSILLIVVGLLAITNSLVVSMLEAICTRYLTITDALLFAALLAVWLKLSGVTSLTKTTQS